MEEHERLSQVENKIRGQKRVQNAPAVTTAILFGLCLCVLGYMLGNNLSFNDLLVGQKNLLEIDETMIPSHPDQLPEEWRNEDMTSTSTASSSLVQTPEERIGLLPDSGYIIQYESIYFQDQYIEDLDFKTATYVGAGYIKDTKRVFQNGVLLPGANPDRCTKKTLNQCGESLQWKSLYAPYALEVTWNNQPVNAAETIPPGTCRNEGFVVGKVENGPLAGGQVLVQNRSECDMWCSASTPPSDTVHYVQFDGYLIPVNTDSGFSFSDTKVRLGQHVTADPAIPKNQGSVINIPNSNYRLINAQPIGFTGGREGDKVDYLFTDPIAGSIYRSKNDCFVSTRPDHVRLSYRLGFDYINESTGVLNIAMLDGTKNNEAYQFIASYHSCYDLIESEWLKPNERLVKVGEFPNGDAVYKLANTRDEHLIEKYEDKNTLASYDGGKNKYLYDEYLAFNPYLYWQDPFGSWVQFMNRRFETAAEKCKPVVYLYPQKTGDFSVYVKPNGGFTKTIPDYGTGWHVTATPDSKITDKKTGVTYPYLYWSGINTDIPNITEGWIVPTKDAKKFLVQKLTKLGLNTQEIADFNEYWITRFEKEGAKEYKIMFLPQPRFEQLAPLSVVGDETPKTVIRVMMYAQPAQNGDVLPEQILPPTPVRTGFTVIEWGGAMFN